MKRKTLSFILALVLVLALAVPAAADGPAAAAAPEVVASTQAVTVDGKAVSAEVYNIDGSNYFMLRDVAALLNGTQGQFSVSYDDATRTVTAESGKAYTTIGTELTVGEDKSSTCVASTQAISVNGIVRDIDVYNIGGNNFLKLRDLGNLLGFGVSYNSATKTVVIDSDDALSFTNAIATTLKPHVDGKEVTVTMYEDCYTASPNRLEDQLISVYVPETATKDSPIIFLVNNAGWQSDTYSGRTQVKSYGTEMQNNRFTGETSEVTVGDYTSTSDTDAVGRALSEGYVIVSYGARSRANGLTGDEYLGHSPATMTDTKAAIRYLKYNAALLPAGDTNKIVVTGTSGGGALSTVIAASGNSPDYYASLYEIGAAGIDYVDGKYVDTLSDDVFGVIAYCPITDLGNACAAYEWLYNDTRKTLNEQGLMTYTYNPNGGMGPSSSDAGEALDNDYLLAISDELVPVYVTYFNSLGLKDEDGKTITADNLRAHIESLMKKEIEEAIQEVGIEQMKADIAAAGVDVTWLTLNDNGTYTYDFTKHLEWLAKKQTLKVPSGFSNYGLSIASQNEDNLFGSTSDEYSPYNPYSWNNDKIDNNVGKDDTGLTWDEYLKTEAGQALQLQLKMTSAPAYLIEGTADSAPNWYVRHGMADRDTSFAVEATLYYSALNNSNVDSLNFEFAWLQPHAGNYDVQEAYDWLQSVVD